MMLQNAANGITPCRDVADCTAPSISAVSTVLQLSESTALTDDICRYIVFHIEEFYNDGQIVERFFNVDDCVSYSGAILVRDAQGFNPWQPWIP